ncbi:MAG: hypothetical protein NVS3B12_00180 [Acidimicrobiales bacterium]
MPAKLGAGWVGVGPSEEPARMLLGHGLHQASLEHVKLWLVGNGHWSPPRRPASLPPAAPSLARDAARGESSPFSGIVAFTVLLVGSCFA